MEAYEFQRSDTDMERISTFAGGQSAVQLLNAATGLLLLRLMPRPEFAIYAIAIGIQGMITILTDLGFGGLSPDLWARDIRTKLCWDLIYEQPAVSDNFFC